MIIRIEDLIESILKKREEFLSLGTESPEVISIKSSNIHDDLLFVSENVPSILMSMIEVTDEYIYITVSDLSIDQFDTNIEFDPDSRVYTAHISVSSTEHNYTVVDSMEEFTRVLSPASIEMHLHPYGIVSSDRTLSRNGVFPSFLYPTPIDIDNAQYLYMFKGKNLFFDLLGNRFDSMPGRSWSTSKYLFAE